LFDGADVAKRIETLARTWKANVVVVVTERLPVTVLALRSETIVIDVVDSMRLHMRERRVRSGFPLRWIWRHEERAFAKLAIELGRVAKGVVASSATALPEYPSAIIIENAADEDLQPRPQPTIDALFTGTLSYWPNAAAAVELCDVVVPRIRSKLPEVRIVVAGRNPTAAVRAACVRASVELMADVADMRALLRTSRLALVPLRWTPAANLKVMEALGSGTPVLAYPAAIEHLPAGIAGVIRCDDAERMGESAVALLTGAREAAEPIRAAHTWKARATQLEAVLDQAVRSARADED
jgi:glycosyltransferase involved in cell wall biosynthesis